MDERSREDIDELVRSHAEGDVTIRQIATIADLPHEVVCDLVESRYENTDFDTDQTPPETYTPDDVKNESLIETNQENESHATETDGEWVNVSIEAKERLDGDDAEKIRIAEQWRRGEISEDKARQQLGDETIDAMIEDSEAFRETMRRDTSDFLQSE